MTSYRRHGRTPVKCSLKLEHDVLGEVVAEAKDISETGILIRCRSLVNKLAIGDALRAEPDPECASCMPYPIHKLTVVRITEDGAACICDW